MRVARLSDRRERVTTVVRREALLDKHCPVCGEAFVGLSRQRYCGQPCASRAAYLRHAEVRKAARRQRCRDKKASTIPSQPRTARTDGGAADHVGGMIRDDEPTA